MSAPAVKLQDVAPDRVTMRCDDCSTMMRVYRVEPVTTIGSFRYCSVCGSSNVSAYTDVDTNHWEALARDYAMPVAVIKMVYKGWNPHEYQRFSDYVAALKAE